MDKNDLFNQVFDMYFDKVYSYFAICFNRNIADDLAQQTFFNVWKYMKRNIFSNLTAGKHGSSGLR